MQNHVHFNYLLWRMEEHDVLDSPNRPLVTKNLWTVRFLVISLAVLGLLFVFSELRAPLHLTSRNNGLILIGIMNAAVVLFAFAGFIMGFTEWNYNKKRALIGLVGNALILVIYVLLAFVAYNTLQRLH